MKKVYLLSIASLMLFSCKKNSVQNNPTDDSTVITKNVFGGSGLDEFTSAIQTTDDGWIAIGTTGSNDGDAAGGHGQEDIWVVKFDKSYKIIWQKKFGSSGRDFGLNIVAIQGGYIITGSVGSNDGDVVGSHGAIDAWVAKINESGSILWKKTFGGSGNDGMASSLPTNDGGLILVGNTTSNDGDASAIHGVDDAWVLKIDASGNKIWQRTYGGNGNDALISLAKANDGGYIAVGTSSSTNGDISGNHGNSDVWMVKLDETGNLQWQKCLGGENEDYGTSVIPAIDGGYLVASYTNSYAGNVTNLHGYTDGWLLNVDNSGNIKWQKTFGGKDIDQIYNVIKSVDNNYLTIGYTQSSDIDPANYKGGFSDAWVLKLSKDGNVLSQKLLGGSDEDYGRAVILRKSEYILIGKTFSNDKDILGFAGYGDAWFMPFKM